MFPVIKNINDVLPYIEDDECFVVLDKGDYKVIDYIIEHNQTFPTLSDLNSWVRRECRGVCFSPDGSIIRRGLQKFKNINQSEETLVENIDWSKPHTVMSKLDGSLIFPLDLNSGYRLGTRKGITDIALMAEKYVECNPEKKYSDFINHMIDLGYTTYFEFFCNDNMVVIDYGEPHMTALAARHTHTGVYFSQERLKEVAQQFKVPIVDTHQVDLSNPNNFINAAKQEKDCEGYVIRFDDGYTVKVKNDWYVQLHHTISGLNANKNIVRLLLDNDMDDILPMLPDRRRESMEDFSRRFWDFYSDFKKRVYDDWEDIKIKSNSNWVRKDWALEIQTKDKYIMSLFFKFLNLTNDEDCDNAIRDFIYNKTNKEIKFNEFCSWAGIDLDEQK